MSETSRRAVYYVVCREHATGPHRTYQAAVNRRAAIHRLGACPEDHEIIADTDGGVSPRRRRA